MRYEARAFVLGADTNGFDDLVNTDGVKVTKVTDGISKDGDAIRIVDYRVPDGRVPVYKPPIC